MTPVLEACGISKAFPGVQALAAVDLQVIAGEVLAVIGENGAGKSTLMNVLAGVLRPDSGVVRVDGREMSIGPVHEAERLGIVLIHQELNLAENLDVAGNVFLGREPTWGGPLRLLDRRVYRQTAEITGRLGLDASPRSLVAELAPGQKQLVEIARALSLQSRILILDEPTSSLTERETARLFDVIGGLRRQGIGIVYITHRLREVEVLADRVVVLRDGRNAGGLARNEIGHAEMVRLMVGRPLKQFFQRTPRSARGEAPVVLEVTELRWSRRQRQPISFSLRAGELVGLAGLMGAGRTELAQTLFGIRHRLGGTIALDGKRCDVRHPHQAIASGILLVPEDRRADGLVLNDSVQNNISLASLERVNRFGLVRAGAERDLAATMCRRLNIRTTSLQQRVRLLSGGNQQKTVLAKWLCRTPRVLILDEPTRGIDVGARSEIYALMDQLATQGLAVLMISSDLEEILGMSDRVVVMHEGSIAGEIPRASLSEEAIMRLATGG